MAACYATKLLSCMTRVIQAANAHYLPYVSTRCYADPELGRPRYSRNGCDAPSGVGTGEEHWKSIHNS
jgi:hypothetical protein